MINLNKEQIEAINIKDGNLLIIASAGTGKTTTIVERYINLVENYDFNPQEVMMTTFTNKAAKDMVEKISKKTKRIPEFIGTMHSLFLRLLRDNYKEAGLSQNFTLLTEENDKKKIIRNIMMGIKLKPTSDDVMYFLDRINRFKNAGIISDDLEEGTNFDDVSGEIKEEIGGEVIKVSPTLKKLAVKFYKEYQKKLKDSNMLDFDDILLKTYNLLNKNELIRKYYSNKFLYIKYKGLAFLGANPMLFLFTKQHLIIKKRTKKNLSIRLNRSFKRIGKII